MKTVIVSPAFSRAWRKIPQAAQKSFNEAILALRDHNLTTLDIKKLKAVHPPAWRIRVGDYRLTFEWSKETITLTDVDHRKNIYR